MVQSNKHHVDKYELDVVCTTVTIIKSAKFSIHVFFATVCGIDSDVKKIAVC